VSQRVSQDLQSEPLPFPLNPAWVSFVRFCSELKYGEIERLSIQDGLPVIAELTKKKVKFIAGHGHT
jgi:hypothetical protein